MCVSVVGGCMMWGWGRDMRYVKEQKMRKLCVAGITIVGSFSINKKKSLFPYFFEILYIRHLSTNCYDKTDEI